MNHLDALSRSIEEQLVAGTLEVPVLPAVASRIMALLSSASPDPQELARTLRRHGDSAFLCGLLARIGEPVMLAIAGVLASRAGIAAMPQTMVR